MSSSAALIPTVRSELEQFVRRAEQEKDHGVTDVYRALRDQAALLYERRLVHDALDSDPLGVGWDEHRNALERAKKLIDVVECSRTVRSDGWCEIDSAVAIRKDAHTHAEVRDGLRLSFRYERRPTPPPTLPPPSSSSSSKKRKVGEDDDDDAEAPTGETSHLPRPASGGGTFISYTIHLSKDHGPKRPLLAVEITAAGDGPSVAPAVPVVMEEDDDEWEDMDTDEEEKKEHESSRNRDAVDVTAPLDEKDRAAMENIVHEVQEVAQQQESTTAANDVSHGDDEADRYVAFVDPEVLVDFLRWSKLDELEETVAVFFLLTFPFYEHEWDIVGFAAQFVLGDDDEDDIDNDENKDKIDSS